VPKISNLTGQKVFVTKEVRRPKEGKPDTKLSKLGKVHMAVFTPDGRRVVGLLVKRPDVVGNGQTRGCLSRRRLIRTDRAGRSRDPR